MEMDPIIVALRRFEEAEKAYTVFTGDLLESGAEITPEFGRRPRPSGRPWTRPGVTITKPSGNRGGWSRSPTSCGRGVGGRPDTIFDPYLSPSGAIEMDLPDLNLAIADVRYLIGRRL
jgi:hypothetical protein